MAKRRKRTPREPPPTVRYEDPDGNVLILRSTLSSGTIRKLSKRQTGPAGSVDDEWQRHQEMLFERLVVDWEIAGLPIGDQKLLLGRYRMATEAERRWVRQTISEHVAAHFPDIG